MRRNGGEKTTMRVRDKLRGRRQLILRLLWWSDVTRMMADGKDAGSMSADFLPAGFFLDVVDGDWPAMSSPAKLASRGLLQHARVRDVVARLQF